MNGTTPDGANWRTSGYSNGSNCIEVANWVKSSFSMGNGNSVELADLGSDGIAVRDSKNPEQEPLVFDRGEWTAFIAGAKAGEFDDYGTEKAGAQ